MPLEAAQNIVEPQLPPISREELLRRLKDPKLTIVDALPAASYEGGHLPGAVSLPVFEVKERARVLLPDLAAEIAIYCAKFT